SEEHTSELQSRGHLVCRLLLEKKKNCAGTVARGTPPAAACWVPDNLLPHACGAAACAVKPDKGYIATAIIDPAGYTDDNVPPGTGVVSGLYPGYLSFDWRRRRSRVGRCHR